MISSNDTNLDNTRKVAIDGTVQMPHDVTRTTLQVLSIGILISAVVWIIRPFLIPIIWASMIVVTTWPILRALQTRLNNKRSLAAAIMTAGLLLIVLVPISLAAIAIIGGADDAYIWAKALKTLKLPPLPAWLSAIPLAGPRLAGFWERFAQTGPEGLVTYVTPYARQALQWFVTQAGSVGMVVIQFFLTVIIAAVLYVKGEDASAGIINFARRLAGQDGVAAAHLAGKAIRGVALGVVVTAFIQAAVGGIGLIVAGVPAAALLAAVMFVLCLAQIGPALVLIPALIWVYWSDGLLWGTILLVFAVLAMTLDNFVRPVLIKKEVDLSLVMIFAGVIGGLLAFGIIGLFIGPVILAVANTLLQAWVSREEGETSDR
jgi:predicted PurR-regulated permease PerM